MKSFKLTRDELDLIFKDIALELKKKLKGKRFSYEIIVVGGASILLNYSFRMSTIDIDCLDMNDALMNEVVNEVGAKYHLPNGWINTDFMKTNSYTDKLIQYSVFHKSYCNDTLIVRTICDEYLIAMKMVSARVYKNDYSDIVGIISENSNLSFDIIQTAIINLYGDLNLIDKTMIDFVKDIFNKGISNYSETKKSEEKNRVEIIKKNKKNKTN